MKETKKRVVKACERCFRRKIKCDGGKPLCGHCFKAKQPCIYQDTHGDQKKQQSPIVSNGSEKSDSIAADSWTQGIEDMHRQDWRKAAPVPPTITKKNLVVTLELRNALLMNFMDHMSSGRLPYIPREKFLGEAETSPLFFNTACAVSAMNAPTEILDGHDRRELSRCFYENACASLAYELERQSLASVISLMMLFIYTRDSLMGTSSLNYRSMFTGMALDMKLNENPAEAMTQEEHEENCVRINCFWYVYIGDHFTSVVLGTAPLIHDTQILVPLPISREEFNLEVFKRRRPTVPYEIGIISSMSGFIPIPPFVNQTSMYILLIKIYSLINRYIQSLKKTNPNAPSYENDYMQGCLKASLTEWKSKMPLVPDGFEPSQQFTTKWWQVYYIVIYSSAVISLNTAKLTIPGEHDPTELLFSPSFLECIEAAKKITEIVSMLVEHNAFGNHGIQRYVSLGIFSSSIIHEILIRIHPDEAQVQLARVNFETNMKAAQFLANTGLPNLLQYQRLKERHANLPQQQASPPGFETLFSFYFDPNTDVNPALFPDQMIQPELFTSDLSFLS